MHGKAMEERVGAFWDGRDFSPDDGRLLTEAGADWLWETDSAHRFTWISPSFRHITGIDCDRLVGRSHLKFVGEQTGSDPGIRQHLDILQGHEPFREFVYELKEAAAGCRWVAVSGFPLFDAEGKFAGYRGIGRNVSRLLELVDARRQGEMRRKPAQERPDVALSDLRRTIDAMNMGIIVVDRRLDAEIINKAFYRIWKISPSEAPEGTSFQSLMEHNRHNGIYAVPDADWPGYVAARLAEVEAGDVAPREFCRADGCTVIYSVTALSGGRRLVTYYDVSEMKAHEAELAEALEKAKLSEAVIDGLPNPIFVKDRHLDFVLVNEAFAELFGRRPHEMIGRKGGDFLARDKAAPLEESERAVLESGESYEVEEDFERAGAAHTRIVRKHRVRTEGDNDYVAVTIFDVTDMKSREREAEEARRQLAEVLETLPAGVVIYDRDDRFVLANGKIHDALPAMGHAMQKGRALREAVEAAHDAGYFRESGDPDLDRIYDSDRQAWIGGYIDRYRARQHVFECRNPDGRWFKAFDTRTDDGILVGVRVDITEIREREEALRVAEQKAVLADRAKSEFLANMSHEIRTPMNGVLGMAELLARSELTEKQRTFTDIILKSGNALLTIINDILDFSKIDAGQLVLDPAPFNLAEAIEDVATLVSTRAKEKDLELIVRVDPALPSMFVGDVGRIRQIVTNLLGNAVKFTEKGHVLVEVSGAPGGEGKTRLHFRVTDTGIGIPQDKLCLIFDKFSQVDASSTRRHEGTGLGLAITSRLVALMDGEIGARSEEGKGSTFFFTVTLADAGQADRPPAAPVDVTGARVLIVDDNSVNRSILLEQTTGWGFDSCAAESGEEGLRVLHAASACGVSVDCVILDYQMPQMSGADMARIVRATAAIADTPIVMLTSVDQSLSGANSRGLRLEAQLIKPARSSVLLETVVATIQKRRADLSRARPNGAQPGKPAPADFAARPFALPDPDAATHGGEVLVAEDNEVNQLVFTQILGEAGLPFRIVENGRKAVESFRAAAPRLILMDVSMPEMNGLEATAAIREMETGTGRRVPIIGVTAHALKGDRERCFEAGMDDYVPKPISPKALMVKLDRWLDQARRDTA